jgi:hypothetical protein
MVAIYPDLAQSRAGHRWRIRRRGSDRARLRAPEIDRRLARFTTTALSALSISELANCFVNYATAICRQDGGTLIPRLPAPPGIAANRGEDTAMAMQHAQFISAKRLAVATISIFALIPILRTDGAGAR